MDIQDAQREVRSVYVGGFWGQLVASVLWMMSAALGTWVTPKASILTIVIGRFPTTVSVGTDSSQLLVKRDYRQSSYWRPFPLCGAGSGRVGEQISAMNRCNFVYSALACLKIGMPRSASFQKQYALPTTAQSRFVLRASGYHIQRCLPRQIRIHLHRSRSAAVHELC